MALTYCIENEIQVITALHTYGEMYNHLTRNVAPFELMPTEARHVLLDVLPTIVQFRPVEDVHVKAIHRCSQLNLRRAVIYDAIHLESAITSGADILYTDNTKDFHRLLTPQDPLTIQGIR